MLLQPVEASVPAVVVFVAHFVVWKTIMGDLHLGKSLFVQEVHRYNRFAKLYGTIALPTPGVNQP